MASYWECVHLLPFVAALTMGFIHLATGRGERGLVVLVAGFLFFDTALVLGWIQGRRDAMLWLALAGLHLVAWVDLGLYLWLRLRRGGGRWRAAREELFRRAGERYALGFSAQAAGLYRRLVRYDPWDPAPRVWLGSSLLQEGRHRRAARAFRRARRHDRHREWELLIRRGLEGIRLRGKSGRGRSGGAPDRTVLRDARKASA